MSKYLPRTAVLKELQQQQKRRTFGLKSGHYTAYPDAAKDHFVVLTHKLEDAQFKATLDAALERIAALRAQQEALKANKDAKSESTKDEN